MTPNERIATLRQELATFGEFTTPAYRMVVMDLLERLEAQQATESGDPPLVFERTYKMQPQPEPEPYPTYRLTTYRHQATGAEQRRSGQRELVAYCHDSKRKPDKARWPKWLREKPFAAATWFVWNGEEYRTYTRHEFRHLFGNVGGEEP